MATGYSPTTRLDPRNWSPRLARVTLATLFGLMIFCGVTMFALLWRGHQLSGVRPNHLVRHDGSRFYQKPTGPFDLREPITRGQAKIHQRYERYARWAGLAGGTFLIAFMAVIFRRPAEMRRDGD